LKTVYVVVARTTFGVFVVERVTVETLIILNVKVSA